MRPRPPPRSHRKRYDFPDLVGIHGSSRQPGVTLLRVKPSWPKSATMWSTAGGGVGGRTPVGTELLDHVEARGGRGRRVEWRFDATLLRLFHLESKRRLATVERHHHRGRKTCSPCETAADCHGRRPADGDTAQWGVGGGIEGGWWLIGALAWKA